MKAILKTSDLKRLIKATAKFISKDGNKRMLQWIQFTFDKEKGTVKAVALDGYKLSIESAKCFDIDENFTAYIKPYLPVGARAEVSTISLVDKNCLIDIDGRIAGFKQPEGDFFNYEKFIAETDQLPIVKEVFFSKSLIKDALESVEESIDFGWDLKICMQLRSGFEPVSIKTNSGVRYVLPCRNK